MSINIINHVCLYDDMCKTLNIQQARTNQY